MMTIIITLLLRDRPQLSSFTSMIIPIVRRGRGLKNDDNYHNILPLGICFFFLVYRARKLVCVMVYCSYFRGKMMRLSEGEGGGVQRVMIGSIIEVNNDYCGWPLI